MPTQLLWACSGLCVVSLLRGDAVAGWREQVEADWLRQAQLRYGAADQTPESDAAGAVDGLKNGKWGFHTAFEKAPWWQVDLGDPQPIAQVVVYNRGDGFAERAATLEILVSSDGSNFSRVYQHDGSLIGAAPSGKPLSVQLQPVEARFVRLRLPGESYFHLDEVEVYPPSGEKNLAYRRPATQSSVSQWSSGHMPLSPAVAFPVMETVERGLKLAAHQRLLGAAVDSQEAILRDCARECEALSPDAPAEQRQALYFKARWAIREMALNNPLLDFDRLLFVKRAPGMFPHMSDQYYGWWSRPGGGLCVLENFKSGEPRLRSLTDELPTGSVQGPDLSYDGERVLFAWCQFHPGLADEKNKSNKDRVPESAFYHLYEMNADGTGLRQLTQGKYDDFDPRYSPNGEIVFVSTRKGTTIQCSDWFTDSTRGQDRPDSYVRCGGDDYRPVPVFTLHAMDRSGSRLRSISAFENFEWTPAFANDGRILYTRWDYIDRFNGHFFSLWSANQDGTNPQLVYGNYTVVPQVKFEARPIPGSTKLVFTAGAHHSNIGGTLCLLDRERGTEGLAPLTRLTPDVRYPETEANDEHYYASPWPISEHYFLVGWADTKLPPHYRCEDLNNPVFAMGIYLLDAFGNLELLHRDPALSSTSPIPLKARPAPPAHSTSRLADAEKESRVLLQDVYRGLEGVRRGTVARLRVVGVVPKVQPHMNRPVLGVSAEDPGKFVLGTVPVEADGSAYFKLPAGVPVFFQALDADGVAVQTMRTLTYAMPGQALSCVGCHEHRDTAPAPGPALAAVRRGPAPLTPGPEGSWPLKFETLVQPVLDRHCAECHQKGGEGELAGKVSLAPDKAYASLMSFGNEDLKKQAFERDRSLPNQAVAANSRLWKLLTDTPGHHEVVLNAEERERLVTWMDTYAHVIGHFSDEQERELQELKQGLKPLLAERAAAAAAP